MDEQVRLLIEETSCSPEEAELALKLANYNLEKAIQAIGTLLQNVIVFKGKLILLQNNQYGLFILVLDKKYGSIICLRSVISYNPIIYETLLETDWFTLEKLIYSYRLQEGSLLNESRLFEQYLTEQIISNKENICSLLSKKNVSQISEAISSFLSGYTNVQIAVEELNLTQYQRYSVQETNSSAEKCVYDEKMPYKVLLKVDLIEYPKGKKIIQIKPKESVVVKITDTRDIAVYLKKLLCGSKDEKMTMLVEEIIPKGDFVDIYLSFTQGIAGIARVKSSAKVQIAEKVPYRWWRKLLPWL